MNARDRADRWVESMLAARGKPLMIIESRSGIYLAVVDRNEGDFSIILANYKSKKIEPFKTYKSQERPIEVLKEEATSRELRTVLNAT